jgi:hypothetical protein
MYPAVSAIAFFNASPEMLPPDDTVFNRNPLTPSLSISSKFYFPTCSFSRTTIRLSLQPPSFFRSKSRILSFKFPYGLGRTRTIFGVESLAERDLPNDRSCWNKASRGECWTPNGSPSLGETRRLQSGIVFRVYQNSMHG